MLVLSPHTDDAELGAGGLIARALREGANVFVAVFSNAVESLPAGSPPDRLTKEFEASMSLLGIAPTNYRLFDYPVRRLSDHRQAVLEHLVRLRRELAPQIVLVPASTDLHQDHQVVYNEGLRAFKDVTVFGYELPWNHVSFHAQCFAEISAEDRALKSRALQEYQSQVELERPYFTATFLESLARVRGTQARVPLAEAYEVTRIRI